MRTTIVAACIVVVTCVNAQLPAIQWEHALGGTSFEDARDIEQTDDGGYIITGSTQSIDGDVTLSQGARDLWVVRLDAAGALVWQRSFGGSAPDNGYGVEQVSDGGFVVVGTTGSSDGDVHGHHGWNDGWVLRLDAAGDTLWTRTLGGDEGDYFYDLEQTDDGFLLMGNSGSFDGGNNFGGSGDLWVVKISGSGNQLWQVTYGGYQSEVGEAFCKTVDGGCIVVNSTASTDGDVVGNHGMHDIWMTKLDNAGGLEWQRCLGGSGSDIPTEVITTQDGGYLVAGWTTSNDGDVAGHHGYNDAWVVKLDSTGAVQWQRCMGGSLNDRAYEVVQTADGGYTVSAHTRSTDGDVATSIGELDIWLLKLDPAGTIIAQDVFGGSGNETPYALHRTADGGYVLAGATTSNDGDVTGLHGGTDMWVVKLGPDGPDGITESGSGESLLLFPDPSEGLIQVNTPWPGVDVELIITDLLGQEVARAMCMGSSTSIDLSTRPDGVYFLTARAGNKRLTGRLVIQ